MNLSILTIFIICAFTLFGMKYLQEICKSGTLEQRLQRFSKNALRITYIGIAAVGVFCLALLLFPLLRMIGFTVIPSSVERVIRNLLKAIFKTESVYASLRILASTVLFAAGFSLLFSVLGFVAASVVAIFRLVERSYTEREPEQWKSSVGELVCSFGKIFLNFAHLRI
ncbi:MAG: hypothetical protein J6A24_02405 [Clostridia bacterium]|nr:hypothetical protein [Clostridia bacterium]